MLFLDTLHSNFNKVVLFKYVKEELHFFAESWYFELGNDRGLNKESFQYVLYISGKDIVS